VCKKARMCEFGLEDLPECLTAEDLAAAVRVGEILSKHQGLYDVPGLRSLRKAWGPVVLAKAKGCFAKGQQEKVDGKLAKKAMLKHKRQHDKKLLETRLLRQRRRQQLNALMENPNSMLAAIPDGAVDDGHNTSLGASGGTESVSQVLVDKGSAQVLKEDGEEDVLFHPRSCYSCKARFYKIHHFYDQFCEPCAKLNWEKRVQTAQLGGKVVLLTGGRVKIGYQIGLKLLRMGATVIVTSRFVADTALRYSKERDFAEWSDRLQIHGLDFRDLTAVEAFAVHLSKSLGRLDCIINNACQTIRRPPAYYQHLLETEKEFFDSAHKGDGTQYDEAKRVVSGQNWHDIKTCQTGLVKDKEKAKSDVSIAGIETTLATGKAKSSKKTSAEMSQVWLGGNTEDVDEQLFPKGQLDVNAQQIDLRSTNSWLLTLPNIPTPEVVEVLAVNSVAPLIFNAKLRDLMVATKAKDLAEEKTDEGRYIINVSAMEGKFYRFKNANHPHTNMAKAALNMMTRTSATEYAQAGIYMNSVDTGWINDENPLPEAARISKDNNFQTPIDEVDAAARVVDPLVAGVNGGERVFGKFLKDYKETEW